MRDSPAAAGAVAGAAVVVAGVGSEAAEGAADTVAAEGVEGSAAVRPVADFPAADDLPPDRGAAVAGELRAAASIAGRPSARLVADGRGAESPGRDQTVASVNDLRLVPEAGDPESASCRPLALAAATDLRSAPASDRESVPASRLEIGRPRYQGSGVERVWGVEIGPRTCRRRVRTEPPVCRTVWLMLATARTWVIVSSSCRKTAVSARDRGRMRAASASRTARTIVTRPARTGRTGPATTMVTGITAPGRAAGIPAPCLRTIRSPPRSAPRGGGSTDCRMPLGWGDTAIRTTTRVAAVAMTIPSQWPRTSRRPSSRSRRTPRQRLRRQPRRCLRESLRRGWLYSTRPARRLPQAITRRRST